MHEPILDRVGAAAGPLGLPDPVDLRDALDRNAETEPWGTRDVDALQGLVWHQALGWGSVEAVARYHTGSSSHLRDGGVPSIAYTWAIRRDGQLVLCNDLQLRLWSQGTADRPGDENAQFMSVLFEGHFTGPGVDGPAAGQPRDAQLLTGLMLWQVCRDLWHWEADDLYGHFLLGKPACPGTTLQTIVEAVRVDAPARDLDLDTVEGRQRALAALGLDLGAIDGTWGPRSRGALVRFQRDHGLADDGVWGPKSRAAVAAALREAGQRA